jgi:predicted cupin superfamily sugar epimerase
MDKDSQYWIQKLALEPHPEGGHYRQTYRAGLVLAQEALSGFPGPRSVSTAIYFLLTAKSFSAFHRLRSDEMWHFYVGNTVRVHVIKPDARYAEIRLGNDPESGETLQAVVKAGCWFASEVLAPEVLATYGDPFALVGCTVAPGFDFDDFELGRREELVRSYPQHRGVIERLTRE